MKELEASLRELRNTASLQTKDILSLKGLTLEVLELQGDLSDLCNAIEKDSSEKLQKKFIVNILYGVCKVGSIVDVSTEYIITTIRKYSNSPQEIKLGAEETVKGLRIMKDNLNNTFHDIIQAMAGPELTPEDTNTSFEDILAYIVYVLYKYREFKYTTYFKLCK